VDPTSVPPWRALEAPTDDDRPTGPVARPLPAGPPSWRDPAVLKVVVVVGLALIVAVASFWLAASSGTSSGVAIDVAPSDAVPSAGADGLATGGEVVVEIAGAVARPGVVRLPAGSRIADLIEAAGGYGPRIDTTRAAVDLRLAAVLKDGDRILVPSRDDPPGAVASTTTGGASSDLLDLGSATLEQLDTLPGIGPVTAQKILDARAEAPFASVDDLRSRGVLGEKTFERVRDLVTVP
jgi:competence protein ComEA